MKRFAKQKPVITIAEIALPIEVGLPLGVIPPHIARLLIAIKRIVQNTIRTTTP